MVGADVTNFQNCYWNRWPQSWGPQKSNRFGSSAVYIYILQEDFIDGHIVFIALLFEANFT